MIFFSSASGIAADSTARNSNLCAFYGRFNHSPCECTGRCSLLRPSPSLPLHPLPSTHIDPSLVNQVIESGL